MFILGISSYYHDSAACIIKDGMIIAAAQEERFTREKHDSSFPHQAILYCIKEADIIANQIDYITFYDKPFLKFERLLETYLAFAPKGFKNFAMSMPLWIKDKLFQKNTIINELKDLLGEKIDWNKRLLFSEHHLSHAASAFFPSPFKNSAILTLDGVGEWTTSLLAIGNKNSIKLLKEIYFPHSLGLLYSAFTQYLGFKVNSGEYKMMGLAPYGKPKYATKIRENIIDIKDDGSFSLDQSYFDYCTGSAMTSKKFHRLFNRGPRQSETEITELDMDLAASIQVIIEEVILKLATSIRYETGQKNLCLAGGVALNCVANGVLLRSKIFENIWIQPAAGDAGGSLGAALATYYIKLNQDRETKADEDSMRGSYLGPRFNDDEVKKILTELNAVFTEFEYDEIIKLTANYIAEDKAVGWMNGRMEFGPRALGNRSIIANPMSKQMQKNLNLKVKYRESFRPFAPSVLNEDKSEWFDLDYKSPYMLIVSEISKSKQFNVCEESKNLIGLKKLDIARSQIPAVTHVDYSARVQTVHKETNPKYYDLIQSFKKITGCPVLINTSFNIRGEPIVCSPRDAYKCFMGTDLDILVIGNILLKKNDQAYFNKNDYKISYKLD